MTRPDLDPLWQDVLAATRRLDSVPFRIVVSELLSSEVAREDPLLVWNELAQAMADDAGELTESDWSRRCAAALDGLLGPVGDADPTSATILLSFSYYESVVIWEYCDNHTALNCLIDQIVARCRQWADSTDDDRRLLLAGVGAAATALSTQLSVEAAWLCGSSSATGDAAGHAAAALHSADDLLATIDVDTLGEIDPALVHVLTVLNETVHDARIYFGLLADQVAPAAHAFEVNLRHRTSDEVVRRRIEEAATAIESALSDTAPGPTLVGVFRSEARAQARALAGMARIVAGERPIPNLILDAATIELVYPFRLPFEGDGEAETHLAEQFRSETAPRVAGCAVTVEKRLKTSTTSKAADMLDPGSHGSSTSLLLDHDVLVLETADGDRFCGVGVEIVLGSLGNHFLRFTLTTDTPVRRRDSDGRWTTSDLAGWTPYELDLMLHRGGGDFGDETVSFVARSGLSEDLPEHRESWSGLLDLAVSMVEELYVVASTHRATPGAGERPAIDRSVRQQLRALVRQQGHIVFTVTEAGAVGPDGSTAVTSAAGLLEVAGGQLLLANQPPLPRAIDEWTCAAPVSDLPDGLVGGMDSYVTCNGDTTLLFVPFSPNWQVLEDKELLLFALSLGSAYIASRERLHELMQQATMLSTPEDLTLHQRDRIEAFAAVVNATEEELTACTAFADRLIDQARGAVVIRPRHDRMLLDHVMERSGVIDLHADLLATRQTAASRIADLRDTTGKIRDARRRRGEVLVERLLLAVAVLAFVDLFWWYFDTHRDPISSGWTVYFWAVTGLMVAAFVVLAAVVLRRTSHSGTSDDSSRRSGAGPQADGSTLDRHG